MGTRSLTFVHDTAYEDNDPRDGEPIVCVYQQYDGYFSGVGTEILDLLRNSEVVNGIGMNEGRTIFNGAGDLAARLITYFKAGDPDSPGGVYIEPPTLDDDAMGAEFTYHVYCRVGQEPYIVATDIYAGRTVEGPASQVDLSEPDADEEA